VSTPSHSNQRPAGEIWISTTAANTGLFVSEVDADRIFQPLQRLNGSPPSLFSVELEIHRSAHG